jgi:hypothetical protein
VDDIASGQTYWPDEEPAIVNRLAHRLSTGISDGLHNLSTQSSTSRGRIVAVRVDLWPIRF